LHGLIIIFFLPEYKTNTDIIQCLSFFFNAYPKASRKNQIMIQNIFFKAILDLEEFSKENSEVNISQIISRLVEWTDQRLLVTESDEVESISHVDLAIEGCELFSEESPMFRKAFCQNLSKLLINPNSPNFAQLKTAVSELMARKEELVVVRALDK
jgi:condensin complex subunit 3